MKKNYTILLIEDSYRADLNDGNEYYTGGFLDRAVCEIASNTSTHKGQAFNITFNTKIDGTHELTFQLPSIYFDESIGKNVPNPLVELLVNKSKLELKIIDEGIEQIYYMIINSRENKDDKGQLSFSYTCSDMFIEELSKTGYGLTFTSNLDETMGVGTIHELTERVLQGSDWKYVKDYDAAAREGTGTLYEYKNSLEWNAAQDRFDEVHTPIPVHNIKYIPEVKEHCYETELFKNTALFGDVNMDGKVTLEDAHRVEEAMKSRLSVSYAPLLKFSYQIPEFVDDHGEKRDPTEEEIKQAQDEYFANSTNWRPTNGDLTLMYDYILQSRFTTIGSGGVITDFTPAVYITNEEDIRDNFGISFVVTEEDLYTDGKEKGDMLLLADVSNWHNKDKAYYRSKLGGSIMDHFYKYADGEYSPEVFWNELAFYGQLYNNGEDVAEEIKDREEHYYKGRTYNHFIRSRLPFNPETGSQYQFKDIEGNFPLQWVTDRILNYNMGKIKLNRSSFLRMDTNGDGKLTGTLQGEDKSANWTYRLKGESDDWKIGSVSGFTQCVKPDTYDIRHSSANLHDPIAKKIREIFPSTAIGEADSSVRNRYSSGKRGNLTALADAQALIELLVTHYITPPDVYLANIYGIDSSNFSNILPDMEQTYVSNVLDFVACLMRIAAENGQLGDKRKGSWFNSQKHLYGDLDLDGKITMNDYTILKTYLAAQLDDGQIALANIHPDQGNIEEEGTWLDPNNYKNINSSDVQDIINFVYDGAQPNDKKRLGNPAYNIQCMHRIYCYEDTECVNSNTVVNFLYNSNNWVDLTGWDTFSSALE